jgi:undecaprenyl-diphosphatase
MDYRIFHAINQFTYHHAWLGRLLQHVESLSIPIMAVATVALWLFARPGGRTKWKFAAVSALASGALAVLVTEVIAKIWDRHRPFVDHHVHVWGTHARDASFPSSHASAAFAIAFAVLLFDRVVGAIFIAAAIVIGVGRVVVGVHYPSDVLGGFLIGLAAAILVVKLGRPLIALLVRLVSRLTDPLLAPLWRLGRRA